MGLIRWLQRIWNTIREPFVFLRPIRFVVVPLALLLWTLIWSDQGQDAIRAVVEFDPRCPQWGSALWFVVWVILLALQSWYWARQMLRVDFPHCVPQQEAAPEPAPEARTRGELAGRHPHLHTWTPRVLGVTAFLIAIGALARAAYLDYAGSWDYTTSVIAKLIAILIVAMIAFIAAVVQRRKILGPSPRVQSKDQLAASTRIILRCTLVLALLFVVWTAVSPLTAGVIFPSPTLLMLSAALWIGIGSWLVYWADLYRVPLVTTLAILAVAFSLTNDNHEVRTLPVANGGANSAFRKSVGPAFEQWLAKLRTKYPLEQLHPVYIVATEGGGIRAAYWTASVLTALQDQAPAFADHVFAISGVSGGSVGATVFTALVADEQRTVVTGDCDPKDSPPKPASFRFAAQQVLSYDFLAPTLASMLHADLVQRFLPVGFIPDRAKALETGWERGWRTHIRTAAGKDDFFSSGFLHMYASRPEALLPSLFLNSTVVERGNRIIASNCLIADAVPDSYDIVSTLGSDMRLSTAAHNSARFTYVSPAGSIRNPGLIEHVVDGGYFENSGAQTAGDVVRKLQSIAGSDVSISLILIRYQEVEPDGKPVPPPPANRFMNEVLSPLLALLDTRSARGTLSYAEAEALVPVANRFEFLLTQERGGIVLPLGWLLARRTRNAIDQQVGTEVPAGLSPAIRPFVARNVGFVNTIAAQLTPRGLFRRIAPDAVQREAMQSEARAKQ